MTGLCDLVVVDHHLIYLTKCMGSDLDSDYAEYKFDLEMRSGEIWVINLLDNIMFKAASNLFFPKSIAYLHSANVIVVTNLAADGLSLFKRETDARLTKIADISLDFFVFSINVDVDDTLWLVIHPVLHESVEFFAQNTRNVATRLFKLKVDIKNYRLVDYVAEEVFRTDGSLLNAVGSSVYFNQNLVIFSFVSDPKVCFI